ncbi:tRNA pseudouridine13 synthase [Balnearium lithotrophicum]|uniref:tRNA pseudouridine13 synthase n=1 Tax=Balnearium lithotrophicum TaxID=223788 RepID=A0A521CGT2_9BACT|nr:tRNA pseudouridine(13) synthase TruD [Balnearium lithotrophicum]SMO58629.1 tRNA pseudouridine13 synthase [Balnearium lithotrophicum]
MRIKFKPEDFKVEEILSEKPSNEGSYRAYLLKKRGLETEEALRRISKLSRVPLREISYGGKKDKNAETLQYISVPKKFRLREIKEKNLSLSEVGFLKKSVREVVLGNRFEILVRDTFKIDGERLRILKDIGIPNYYGEQRFTSSRKGKLFVQLLDELEEALKFLFQPAGFENSRERRGKRLFLERNYEGALTYLRGWRKRVAEFLLKGGDLKKAFRLIPKSEIEFQINVLQSFMFNEKLREIIEGSNVETFKLKYRMGELLYPKEKIEVPGEIPSYIPFSKEYSEIVERIQLNEKSLKNYISLFHRFKRRTMVKPKNFHFELKGEGLLLKFELPKGSYATNILRFLFNAV